MASSGGTIGIYVGGATESTIDENALPYTLLSLNRYAKIMQIDPAHFNGVASATIFPLENKCSDIWFRWDWQASDSVSWESLAQQIKIAEDDIKAYLRFSPAPDWEAVDVRPWERYHRKELYGLGYDSRLEPTTVQPSYDYIISPGRRAVTEILAGAVVTYSDPDGDGFNELATISAATSLTDTREIKLYFAGKGGAREWEIRPIKSKVISGGIVTFKVNSWQLVKPTKRELPPVLGGAEGLDLLDSANYVTTLDIYREYTDTTAISAEMFWASNCGICGGVGCASCSLSTKTGCLRIISVNPSQVQVFPASYSSDLSSWAQESWPTGQDPVQVNLWYKAGFQDNEYLAGRSYDPLSHSYAQAIAWLATARLERPFCNCGTASALARRLQMDMAVTDGDGSKTFSFEDLENPFGTRIGEVWAWRRLKKLQGKPLGGFAV